MLLASLIVALLLQLLWIVFVYRRSSQREELFRIITENAADMIALVDSKSRRLYNSPSYERVLGYTADELAKTPIFEQIHPDDRFKVLEAAREARATGNGKTLQYRLRHKNGDWRILESTARPIKNQRGEVEKLVIVNRDITQRVATEEKLAHNALHDALTGLPNRRLFLDRLQRCFAHAQRDSKFHYAVLLVDIDGFKALNQSMGSEAGDQVLVEAGLRLQAALRATDAVARAGSESDVILSRLGGDEFAVLLEGCSEPSDVLRVADRIQSSIAQPMVLEQGEVRPQVSIGSAISTPQLDRAEQLFDDAETALRRAQTMGGNRSELFDPAMHNRAVTRLKLESDLRTALNRGEFRVFYQPIIQIDPQQVVGFEALLRWQHPEQGLISPREFLDAAEDAGLMALIDQWVIREASRTVLRLEGEAGPLQIAINLSARHFTSPQFLESIKTCLREAHTRPGALQLGISQRVAVSHAKLATDLFARLRRMEIATAIDDFGAQDLSLPALRHMHVDALKIDRGLIRNMQAERASYDVVEIILAIARKLRAQAVAQGVEKSAQLSHLRALGCNFAQGYLFSPPLDSEAARNFLREQKRSQQPASAAAN